MDRILALSTEGDITAYSGTLRDVKSQLFEAADGEGIKVVALTMPGATDEQVSALASSFKKSSAVLRYLSHDLTDDLSDDFIQSILDQLVPKSVPISTRVIEAKMLASAKTRVIESGDFLTAKEIATMAGFSKVNPSSQPNKWKREKAIFAFEHLGVDYFPGYALDVEKGYRPYPAIGRILEIFGARRGGWGAAFWFESPNSYLGGAAPKTMLAKDPERVIKAATRDMEPISHG